MANSYRYRKYNSELSEQNPDSIGHPREFNNSFATVDEIKGILTKVDLTAPEIPTNHGGAAFISDTKEAYVDDGDYHTLILGSTGSMKTRLFIFPTVFTLGLAGENMVIADPKGEIYDSTSGFLKEKGYEIMTLNLRDLDRSDCWNPLAEGYHLYNQGRPDEGLKLVIDFVDVLMAKAVKTCKDIYWPMSAKVFLQGIAEIILRGARDITEVNVSSMLPFFGYCRAPGSQSSRGSPLMDFITHLSPANSIRQHIEACIANGNNAMAGIMGQASGSLNAFSMSKQLQRLCAKSTIDLHAFKDPNRKVAVFMIVPDEQTTFHFFVSSFVKQLYSTAVDDAYSCPGGALPRRLNFILDEFANLPRIPGMSTMITAARSRNIRFYLVVQSDNQLKESYDTEAETIKTNCLNWVYLNTKEGKLIEQVQTMTGTRMRSTSSKPLVSQFELTNLRKIPFDPLEGGAQALILISRCKPFMTFLPDISRFTQFVKYPPIELPHTDPTIHYFDAFTRAFNLSDSEIHRIYGGGMSEPPDVSARRPRPEKFKK